MCQDNLQVVYLDMKVSKNELCEYIDSNVPVEFDDTNVTIRYEPARDTKVLSSNS